MFNSDNFSIASYKQKFASNFCKEPANENVKRNESMGYLTPKPDCESDTAIFAFRSLESTLVQSLWIQTFSQKYEDIARVFIMSYSQHIKDQIPQKT